jgi:hypothetical protein
MIQTFRRRNRFELIITSFKEKGTWGKEVVKVREVGFSKNTEKSMDKQRQGNDGPQRRTRRAWHAKGKKAVRRAKPRRLRRPQNKKAMNEGQEGQESQEG